jgi:hypothetical protein
MWLLSELGGSDDGSRATESNSSSTWGSFFSKTVMDASATSATIFSSAMSKVSGEAAGG